MRRTIPILSGLAILCVILNHSNWHVLRDIPAGDLGQALPFIFIDQITKFAVPAFVFIAGYFVAYATSEGKKDLRWEIVLARLEGLAWPWAIWSLVLLVVQLYKGTPLSMGLILTSLFVQYYFVPLLLFYYLSSTFVVKLAKSDPKALLLGAGAIQLAMVALFYGRIYWAAFPDALDPWIDIGLAQYLRFAIYFPLGVVAGIYAKNARAWLAPVKRYLPWAILAAYGLQVGEAVFAFNLGPDTFPIGGDQTRITSALFSLAILLTFVAYERISLPWNRQLTYMGTNSYGLYLSHYALLGMISYGVRTYLPQAVSYPVVFIPLLYATALGSAIAIMEIGKRIPLKGVYRVVFG